IFGGAAHALPRRSVERTIVFAADIKHNSDVNLRFIVSRCGSRGVASGEQTRHNKAAQNEFHARRLYPNGVAGIWTFGGASRGRAVPKRAANWRASPSPSGRKWREAQDEGVSAQLGQPSLAASRHPLPRGEGPLANTSLF